MYYNFMLAKKSLTKISEQTSESSFPNNVAMFDKWFTILSQKLS